MSQMEQGMESIIKTFHQHASKEGDPDTLSKKEFKQLVNKDMPNSFKKEKQNEKDMDRMMEDLDRNEDGDVDFDEFVTLLVNVLIMNHKEIHKNESSHGYDHGPSYGPSLREGDHSDCHNK